MPNKIALRTISGTFAFLLSAGVLTACGGGNGNTATAETTAVVTETEAVTTEAPKPYLDNLGEYNYNNAHFGMLTRSTRHASLAISEATGEVYNDSVYERNQMVQERFGVVFDITELPDTSATWSQTVSSAVAAGDNSYDIVMPDYWWGIETGGYFIDLNQYDNIMDFDQPWWCAGWNNSSEIFGKMYSAVGSLCIDIYANTLCIYFNQKLIDDYKLSDPYDLVESHKWTLDKMTEMAKTGGADVNGDGVYDMENDKFGAFFNLQSGRALLWSAGMKIATPQKDGTYAYSFWNDTFVERYDKVYKIINESDFVNYNGSGATNQFAADKILFLGQNLATTSSLREMTSDYGIVPYPMFNEKQEDYISYNYGTFYLSVPKSASNPEMSAVVLEAMNAQSYKTVKTAYFEVNMKEKFSRDKKTVEMLDMIVDRIYFDFTFVNEAATNHIAMFFFTQIAGKNDNITSAYEGQEDSFKNYLTSLFEKYKNE